MKMSETFKSNLAMGFGFLVLIVVSAVIGNVVASGIMAVAFKSNLAMGFWFVVLIVVTAVIGGVGSGIITAVATPVAPGKPLKLLATGDSIFEIEHL
jgi:ABC-type thiamin/hydroxymethylpyrimidine transport system permease subunit